MSPDLEFDAWRHEWTRDTEALPDLKRRIRGQNRRLVAGAALIAACLVGSIVVALRHPSAGWAGFAVGVWVSALASGGYALWLRRGTWEPAAETTRGYLELLHRRAFATLRKTVVLRRALLVVFVACGAYTLWDVHARTPVMAAVVAALALEIVLVRALERRRRLALDRAARLLERASDAAGDRADEGRNSS